MFNTSPFKVSRYSGKDEVMPEETVLIEPIEVVRNHCGNWTHPDLPAWGEGERFDTIEAWFDARQIEWRWVALEDDISPEEYQKWAAKGHYDAEGREPTKPEGAGWFVLSIHDTDDGPVCWWARREVTP
ncbi:hypothetical protein [Pseudomonas sp. LF052]